MDTFGEDFGDPEVKSLPFDFGLTGCTSPRAPGGALADPGKRVGPRLRFHFKVLKQFSC